MSITLNTLVIVTIIIGISYLIALTFLKKLRHKRELEAQKLLKEEEIIYQISAANSFGQTSLGHSQVRGTGTLIFSNKRIFFLMWLPKKELSIPISSIQKIETPKTHLGKTKLRKLLKVHFINEKKEPDSIAWMVENLEEAKKKLESLWQE